MNYTDLQNNHPMYQYAIQKRDEGNKTIIYHYTTQENFFLILESMSLKLSVFSKSDDLNEANLSNIDVINNIQTFNLIERFIKKNCSYLSFIQDDTSNINGLEGTNHPRMWSQYAQRGNGVCLALDEKNFIKINEEKINSIFHKFEPVNYGNKNGASIRIDAVIDKGEEESFIKKYYQELFFKKHIDWENENEKRLMGINIPEFLSIYGALEFVCLGPGFLKNESSMTRLLNYITDPCSTHYGYLIPQSFAGITPYSYGYFTDDALAIYEIQMRLNNCCKYSDYIEDWC